MEIESKIYVAGHRGLVGSAIVRNLTRRGYRNLIYRTHQELDLTDQHEVLKYFDKEHPDYVFSSQRQGSAAFMQTIQFQRTLFTKT